MINEFIMRIQRFVVVVLNINSRQQSSSPIMRKKEEKVRWSSKLIDMVKIQLARIYERMKNQQSKVCGGGWRLL